MVVFQKIIKSGAFGYEVQVVGYLVIRLFTSYTCRISELTDYLFPNNRITKSPE
jgi:hypothetical protein